MTTRGIMLETGSLGRDAPFGIRPELYADPLAFYQDRVRPLLDSGVRSILWHRPFGEPTQGDAGQDFDTINYHLTERGGNRNFAQRMASVLSRLSRECDLTIYVGAIWQARMAALRDAGDYREWSRRLWLQMQMFPAARFAFDGSSNADEMRHADYAAICLLNAQRPGSIMVEALPDRTTHCLHGLPAMVWESKFHHPWMQGRIQYAGPITRILTTHVFGRDAHPDTIKDPIAFAADCKAKGHSWYVTQEMLDRTGVSLDEMMREAA